MHTFKLESIKFCTAQSYHSYAFHIQNRRNCYQHCENRDCKIENYNYVTEVSLIPRRNLSSTVGNMTIVEIWPNRKLNEFVEHFPEINIFELIGILGGHAHIFLGLSAIQLYDVIVDAIRSVQRFYQRVI